MIYELFELSEYAIFVSFQLLNVQYLYGSSGRSRGTVAWAQHMPYKGLNRLNWRSRVKLSNSISYIFMGKKVNGTILRSV
jgi:hypothetical protein